MSYEELMKPVDVFKLGEKYVKLRKEKNKKLHFRDYRIPLRRWKKLKPSLIERQEDKLKEINGLLSKYDITVL